MYVLIVDYKTCYVAESRVDVCKEFLFWWIFPDNREDLEEVSIEDSELFDIVRKHIPEYKKLSVIEILVRLLLLKEYEEVFDFVNYHSGYVLDLYNAKSCEVNDELFQAKLLAHS